MQEQFDFTRFVAAQAPILDQIYQELAEGRKRTHWMWYIFPQLCGLGHSPLAQLYAIASLAEARAFLQHAILGSRLLKCTGLVNQVTGRSAYVIFGSPDDMKFHSSMTLFAMADPIIPEFQTALEKYFGGEMDKRTVEMLG